jgi:hypothetical protein
VIFQELPFSDLFFYQYIGLVPVPFILAPETWPHADTAESNIWRIYKKKCHVTVGLINSH